MPGSNVIEVQFEHPPEDMEKRLHSLSDVTSVQHEGAGMYRVLTGNGSRHHHGAGGDGRAREDTLKDFDGAEHHVG